MDALVTEVASADHETTINIVGLSTDFTSCVTVCLIGATSDNSVPILFVHEAENVTNAIQFWCQHLTTVYIVMPTVSRVPQQTSVSSANLQ